jgi:hypothetical protein
MAYPPPDSDSGTPNDDAARLPCSYQHLIVGLTNRSLRALIAGLIPGYGARQMTYDLRRLRRKGFIQRIPRTQRELTGEGRRLAVFFTKTHADPQPSPRRARPHTPYRDRRPQPARTRLSRVRREQSRRRSDRPVSRPER